MVSVTFQSQQFISCLLTHYSWCLEGKALMGYLSMVLGSLLNEKRALYPDECLPKPVKVISQAQLKTFHISPNFQPPLTKRAENRIDYHFRECFRSFDPFVMSFFSWILMFSALIIDFQFWLIRLIVLTNHNPYIRFVPTNYSFPERSVNPF